MEATLGPKGGSTKNYVVAQLVEHPIEIVQYQQLRCRCNECGCLASGELPEGVVPGQDLIGEVTRYARVARTLETSIL